MPESSQPVHFSVRAPRARRSWLSYFLAAVSAGTAVANEELLRYYWVMPEESAAEVPHVIRIQGEKGERYEEVFSDETLAELKQHPAIMEGRLARQAALRKEALELARQLREKGKDPIAAYEEAWTQVYGRNWLNPGKLHGSCKLEDMLSRLASESSAQALTEEEEQWLLEALLEDDDRLEDNAGLELLRRLAAQLRKKGYALSANLSTGNDELMQYFAAALENQTDSMAAFREALFHTHRGQIMTHSLVGYRAPWGIGLGGVRYHQAPQPVEITEASGNTQVPVQPSQTLGSGQQFTSPDLKYESSGVLTDFLASAPSLPEKETDEDDEEETEFSDTATDGTGEAQASAAPMMMMRSFSMRSAAYAVQNEGEADAPESPDSPVHGGVVELAQDEILDVGANRVMGGSLAGGSLENVQMVVTGEIFRPVTKDYVTVHNLVSSADGTNPGIMRDVTLYAGTSTEYATLHNIAFAGQSELTGYVTFEKTQTTGDIYVAAGGTLTLNNLTFDLRGLAMEDEKTLIDVKKYGGTLKGWAKENVHFVYSGVKVNNDAVVIMGDGTIKLSADHEGKLYWNGATDNMWNIGSENWSSAEDSTEGDATSEVFTALSNVYFGGGNAANQVITVTQDMVVADLYVTDGGYSFSGARVAVLGDASFTHEKGAVTFNNHLVVQGGLLAEGSGSVALLGGATIVENAVFQNLSTTIGGDMTVSGKTVGGKTVGGKLTVLSGDAATAGTLTITGNVTAKEMELVVNGGSASVSGNLTTTTITENKLGSITIGGTAEQRYTGVVTAGNLIVNTTEKDVFFNRLHVDELTVGKGATVHVRTSADSVAVSASEFPVINLYGTLALEAAGATYNHDYQVNVLSNAAKLLFGSGCTIDGLSNESLDKKGLCIDGGEQTLYNLLIEARSNSATVEEIKNLGSLTVTTGAVTVKSATNAVHGKLILDSGKLKLESDNIMASGSGEILLKNGGRLDIGTTTQTLSARNEEESLSLSGASSITGAADGGVRLENGVRVNYKGIGNSIEAKLTAEKDFTLKSTLAGSSLEISGHISGSGEMELTGSGSVVLSSANTDFTGTVTVQEYSTLTLQNADALSNAGVVLNEDATLALDAPDTVKLKALTLSSGSTLAISSITGTKDSSYEHAVLNVTDGVTFDQKNAVLNVIFAGELKTMTTYNLIAGLSAESYANLGSFNVQYKGAALDASQYTIRFDEDTDLLYIHTMMGNVWDGKAAGDWSEDTNWISGGKYKTAIFGNLNVDSSIVNVNADVAPGDIYFVAGETNYTLSGTGALAEGTNIHKDGSALVTLQLSGNNAADTALGDVDVRVGSLILDSALAAKGAVSVGGEKDVSLVLNEGTGALKMYADAGDTPSYTYTVSAIKDASAELRGVTMDAAGIRGTKDVYNAAIKDAINGGINAAEINASNLLVQGNAELQYLILTDFEAAGNVTLSDVTLTSSSSSTASTLTGVTIGSGVVVDESGSYILSGNITFDGKLTNNGFVTLDKGTSLEIGKIEYDEVAADGKAQYVYQFISSTKQNGFSSQALTADNFSINGINLGSGLKDKDGVKFTDNENGSITLSIYDGTVSMPQWDERWGKPEKAPSLSRRYAGNADYVELAAGLELDESDARDTNYYRYSSIVSEDNSAKVNGGDAIVVTLAEGAKGKLVVGGLVNKDRVTGDFYEYGRYVHNVEVWIEDRSSVRNIIGGLDNGLKNAWGHATPTAQTSATHVLVDVDFQEKDNIPNKYSEWDKSYVIAGSRWCDQDAESFVTVRSGEIYNVFGGSCGGHYSGACKDYENDGDPCPIVSYNAESAWWGFSDLWVTQYGTSHVYVEGGRIGEIFAGGVYANLNVGAGNRAVEMILTGGELGGADLRVFGGANHGDVTGDIYIRMEGSAKINSRLVGGSNAGTVNGNIVLDLISGEAFRVDAAGLGWYIVDEWSGNIFYDPAYIKGDVQVNLYSGFTLGIGAEGDLSSGIYGGREQSNQIILVNGDDGTVHTSTLHFAEGEKYKLGFIDDDDGYTTLEASHIVTGFDRFVMEENAHAVLGLGKFDIDMDVNKKLHIEGKGVVEVIGHGANLGRNIQLEKDATLKISTSVIGASGSEDDRTITVTDGSTIDFSGAPAETAYPGDSDYAGLGFKVVIAGNGVDGKGALYKGKYDGPYDLNAEDATSTANRIVLPNVKLQDDASVGVEAGETLYMNAYALGESNLDLAGYTFTKLGAGNFITRSVKTTPGTILVQQGTFGFDKTSTAAQTDMVLAAGAKLKLDTAGAADLELRSLIGSGMVFLNGSTLTLNTEKDSKKDSGYYSEYMVDAIDKPQAYDQFSETTGFAYAVFSGLISDSGKLAKAGSEVQYISGSSNTYTGGTLLQGGRLYLLGTSEASEFSKDKSTVASGVVGKSDIEWASDAAELYLGHGTRIYNQGTTNVQGGSMTIGVEGVTGGVLEDFVGIHGTVTMGGVEYVKIDTYNLMAIDVDGQYEDGSSYVAGTDIDHTKTLLVKKTDRDALANVIGVLSSKLIKDVVYVEIDTHNLKSIGVNAKYADGDDTIDYVAGEDIDHTKKLLVKESDLGAMDDFISIRGTVALGGVKYVEIDTHNLKSIAVDGLYADGTAYVAGTDIDRNKMLLVKMDDWETAKETKVTSLSDDGYNEAVYSGELSHSDNVTAGLRKVGTGTLVLDQSNSYTGDTTVEAGTLRLRGWATLGSNVKNNTATVQEGATLMFTHNHGYVNGTTSADNDIEIAGTGDARWVGNSATDGGTAALISAVGPEVEFTLSGDISGSGNVRHCGDGKLVLNGDSSYTGGTVITRGVVEVQSATGLGKTDKGMSAVKLGKDADLYVTVEDGTTGEQLVTTFATVGDDIQGDVNIVGTDSTERILHMADNGYSAATTTLGENGTLLLRGAPIEEKGVSAESDLLTGKGSVVVSDPTGSGATASFGTITDYTGDFRVEGDKASIQVKNGSYSEGSIAVSGQQASVQIGGNVSIEAGESLQLSSTGFVPDQKDEVDMGTGAVLVSHGMVSVAAGAELSASKAETVYAYDDISKLEKAASVTVSEVVLADEEKINAYHQLELDDGVLLAYKGRFDADIAINQQAVAGVKADVGLTLAGGSTYRTDSGHISLMGGSLTLDTLADNQLTFNTVLDVPYETLYGKVQLVLFSDVSSVKFIYGDITETAQEPGVYYTSADYFLTGCDYIDSQTMLVYDSHAGVVYLEMKVPEPATTALGLVALAALAARRRRKNG